MKNWKTTVAGVAVGIVAALTAMHYITGDQATAILGALAALGLGLSKDHNVTGGSKQQ